METLIIGAAMGCFASGMGCFAAGMGAAFVARIVISSMGGA